MTKRIKREPLLAPDGSGLQSTYYTGLLFGPNGCGKTTLMEKITLYYVRLGGKAWAIDPNGAWEDTPGVKSLWPANEEEGIDDLLASTLTWGPGLLDFDDADAYIRYSTRIQRNYLTRNRHFQKDMLISARRPQGIPKDAIGNARFIALFAGTLTEPHARDYLTDALGEEIIDAVPRAEYNYLLIQRVGACWKYERRKTQPRSVKTQSDKT